MDNLTARLKIEEFCADKLILLLNDEITKDEFIDELIELNFFYSEKDLMLFLFEKITEESNKFEAQFPIKYYSSEEEYINDDFEITDDDLESLTDEYIEKLIN